MQDCAEWRNLAHESLTCPDRLKTGARIRRMLLQKTAPRRDLERPNGKVDVVLRKVIVSQARESAREILLAKGLQGLVYIA